MKKIPQALQNLVSHMRCQITMSSTRELFRATNAKAATNAT